MRIPVRIVTGVSLSMLVVIAAGVLAQRGATPATSTSVSSDATARIVSAAQAVLASLDEAGRTKVQFRFDDAAQKTRWSNLPSPMFQRDGLRMGDITPAQRAAVMTLLQAALSRDGYRKVTDIMHGDEVLRTTGDGRGGRAGGGPAFGEAQYYLAFLGTPSTTSPWM